MPTISSETLSRPADEVRLRAARIAAALRGLGLGHGDRYAMVMRNGVDFVEVNLAAGIIGAVPVPVNWHWTGADLRHILHDSGISLVLAHTDLLGPVVENLPAGPTVVEVGVSDDLRAAFGLGDVPPTGEHPLLEDLISSSEPVLEPVAEPAMAVIYTSGTTGLAKGILRDPIPASDFPVVARNVMELMVFAGCSSTLVTAPMYHTAPNVQAVFGVALGLDVHLMSRFDPRAWLRTVQEHRIEHVQMVPTMFSRLLQLPEAERLSYDVSSLKAVVHAAAPCPPDLKRAVIDWLGPVVWEYYGGSEGAAWVMLSADEWLAHPGSVGRPFADTAVAVVGPDGQDAAPGETGIVYGKAFGGWPEFTYIGRPEARAEIARGDFVTIGDIGHLDEDGYLYLTDRVNDMVISGGVNVYPAEIETCLHGHPAIADVAVFGVPDADLGEVLAAHVQLVPGESLTEDDVRAYVAEHLARYKAPRVVVFEESLPREDSGKLFKRRLKSAYWPTGSPLPR